MKNIHVHKEITPELSQKINNLFLGKLVKTTTTYNDASPLMGHWSWHRSNASLFMKADHYQQPSWCRTKMIDNIDMQLLGEEDEAYYHVDADGEQWDVLPPYEKTSDFELINADAGSDDFAFMSLESDDDILFIPCVNGFPDDVAALMKEAGYEQYIHHMDLPYKLEW